jgi:hypothetical protein
MEVIMRILQMLLDEYPEYIATCGAIGFVDMTDVHLSAIIASLSDAETRNDRTTLCNHFRQSVHVLRRLGYCGYARWCESRRVRIRAIVAVY